MIRRIALSLSSFLETRWIVTGMVLTALILVRSEHDYHAQGTTNRITKFTGPSSINDSSMTDNGITVSMTEPLDMASHQIHNVTDPTSAQDAATQAYVLAHGGTSIGGSVGGGTAKSVLFVNPAATLDQDPTQFAYVKATNNLQVGADAVTAGFTAYPLTLSVSSVDIDMYMWNTNTAGYASNGWLNTARAYRGAIGYGNTAVAQTDLRGVNFIETNGNDFLLHDFASGIITTRFFQAGNQVAMQLSDGQSAPGGATSTAKFRYNTAVGEPGSNAGAVQVSINGGNYANIVVDGLASTSVNPGVACGGGASAVGSSRKGHVDPGAGATGCTIVFPYNPISCNITCESSYCTYSYSGNTVTTSALTGNRVDYDCN